MTIRTLSSRVAYENRWMKLIEDEIERSNGIRGVYAYVHKPPFAIVIPFDGKGVTLVEQDRYPVKARFWEFPQGALEDHRDAAPEEIARRELREETGLLAEKVTHLGSLYIAYGMSDQPCHVFLAEGLTQGELQREAEEVDLISKWFSVEDLERMIRNGEIKDSATLSAFLLWRGLPPV